MMLRHDERDGYAEYVFKVIGPMGFTFHCVDRYSSMRSYYKMLIKNLDDGVSTKLKNLPAFPKKKMFNSLEPKFLNNRMTQLELFLNAWFSIPAIAQDKLTLTWLTSKAADQDSQDKIQSLTKLIQDTKSGNVKGKPNKKTS